MICQPKRRISVSIVVDHHNFSESINRKEPSLVVNEKES